MPRSKSPRKKYRPSWNGGNVKLRCEGWKVDAVFRPLETILDGLERDGAVTATAAGVPIFRDANDGCWYETAPAVEGVACAFEMHAKRQGRAVPIEPLLVLARKLRYAMPLEQADVAAARQALEALRAEAMQMTAAYARDLVQNTRIRIELDAKEAA
ncbi:hypothetical protein NDR89_20425 [Cupriavidus gilardii]|uniref:Uncharacterized protein n=1 Tax=Cupriavidus gilardii TaxID=82541 RepID=A0ABY4VWA1_9BURK|nr:hypothetical protein [Cupriavidus gilardii]USE79005.1 hypothetical protein NDR89_20425 [Cupriavidus gilardii]